MEDPSNQAPEELYEMTQSPTLGPNTTTRVEIVFTQGLPSHVSELVTGKTFKEPFDILTFLNKIGSEHGVGRIDIVENRYIGLKSRGIYECPGATILYCAHEDLEVFTLDREVLRVKTTLRDKMVDYVYNGYWFSPEAEFVSKCLEESQKGVTGRVLVEVYKGSGRNIL